MIKLIAFDVDGTLTDGSLYIGKDGETVKKFHAQDGLGLSLAHKMGYKVGLITGRKSPFAEARGRELHLDFVLTGITDKVKAMEDLLSSYGFSKEEASYMGDDWNDLSLLKVVGLPATPINGREENKRLALFISSKEGGNGAARELIEFILTQEGRMEEAISTYLQEGAKEVLQ